MGTLTMLSFSKCFSRFPGTLDKIRNNAVLIIPSAVTFVSSAILNNDQDDKDPLGSNPYYGKYSKKMSSLQPEELLARLNSVRRKDNLQSSTPGPKHHQTTKPSFTKQQNTLKDILQLEIFQGKTIEEISDIWMTFHHQQQDCIAGIISSDVYNVIQERAALYPSFLLPLPRNQGYEYIVSQFSGSEVHFTPLINYQTFKENAPECLAVRHYIDLQQEKGIVLMKGEFNRDVIDSTEATCLANQLQRYYGEEDYQRLRLLQRFNDSPTDFQHMDLIVQLERLAN